MGEGSLGVFCCILLYFAVFCCILLYFAVFCCILCVLLCGDVVCIVCICEVNYDPFLECIWMMVVWHKEPRV
jgi:hypothetical protein